MESRVHIALLYDFYGSLLTKRQQHFMELYFGEDLSLGEIAGEFKVSRQAVYDILTRAETSLKAYEQKLRLVERFLLDKRNLAELNRLVVELMESGLSPSQKILVEQITALVRAMDPGDD